MKKYTTLLLLLFPLFLLTNCGENKKENTLSKDVDLTEATHQWSEKNMLEFERNCVGFLESEDVQNAKKYCDCLLESSVKAYPDPTVAMELEQNEIVELFINSNCVDDLLLIKIEDPWTDEVEQLFVEHCKTAQKEKGITEADADNYCSCALGEIKQIVPNPQHVMTLTEEELAQVLEKCK